MDLSHVRLRARPSTPRRSRVRARPPSLESLASSSRALATRARRLARQTPHETRARTLARPMRRRRRLRRSFPPPPAAPRTRRESRRTRDSSVHSTTKRAPSTTKTLVNDIAPSIVDARRRATFQRPEIESRMIKNRNQSTVDRKTRRLARFSRHASRRRARVVPRKILRRGVPVRGRPHEHGSRVRSIVLRRRDG